MSVRRDARARMSRGRRWTIVAGLALVAAGAFQLGCAIWWGTAAGWDLTVRVDTPRIVDSSAGILVFGGIITGAVFLAAGAWVLRGSGRRTRRS